MESYAKTRLSDNNNADRKGYSLFTNSCNTFAADTIEAGGIDMPMTITSPRPNAYIEKAQKDFSRISFDPKSMKMEKGGSYVAESTFGTIGNNMDNVKNEVDNVADSVSNSVKAKASSTVDSIKNWWNK